MIVALEKQSAKCINGKINASMNQNFKWKIKWAIPLKDNFALYVNVNENICKRTMCPLSAPKYPHLFVGKFVLRHPVDLWQQINGDTDNR